MASQIFLDWCEDNGIVIDPRIQICDDESRGIHVVSKNAPIPPGVTLVRIPKDAVLSVRSCPLSKYIPFELHGLGAQLGLSFAVYSEILKGKGSSRWSGYLQTLPSVDLPVFWGCSSPTRRNGTSPLLDPDPDDLLLWLRGTEVMKRLNQRDESNQIVLDHIDRYYRGIVLPLLRQPDVRQVLSEEPNLAGFREAYSLVSSRAFLLDAYHGLAMTPVADAFNHALENHVHIQSEFYVCPECGSLRECEHDFDDHDPVRYAQTKNLDHDLYYEMVSNAEIPPYEEVFNTYGEGLCNAQLLMQYGFILDPNDNDLLNFDVDEILCWLSLPRESRDEILDFDDEETGSLADLFLPSSLVFSHAPSQSEAQFCINSDGKISHHLWIFLIKLLYRNTSSVGPSIYPPVDQLRELITAHMNMEVILQGDRSIVEDGNDGSDAVRAAIIVEVARKIVRLCEMRKEATGHPEYTGRNLGELLDAVPEVRRRFRLTLSVLMSEHSILDSCMFNWLDLAHTFEADTDGSTGDDDEVVA